MAFFRLFAASSIAVLYSVAYTVWQIQLMTQATLVDWLAYQRSIDMLPSFRAAGIWSIEEIAVRRVSTLPDYIAKNADVLPVFLFLQGQAARQIMLPLWLKDQGLENYAKISGDLDLVTLSKKYPGEIYISIRDMDHLSPGERASLRKDVHDFKIAISKFVSKDKKSDVVTRHIKKYKKLIVSWHWRYGQKQIESLLASHKIDWSRMSGFLLLSLAILWLSLPKGLPMHGAFILPVLASYWFVPEWGKLNIASVLFIRSFKEPARMALFCGILYIWMMAADDLVHSPFILLLVIPTIFFTLAMNTLRCQPLVIREESSKLYDLTISGIGYIEKDIKNFIANKKVSWIYSKLASVGDLAALEWDKIQRIKIEEVDIPWNAIKDIIEPSIKSESLKVIWIADNYAISDNDAEDIAKIIINNKNIDTLRITFNWKQSLLDFLYHLLMWNQNDIRFTNDGALKILDKISEQEKFHLKTLDFCGIHLKQSFVKKILETPKLKKINILVNKRLVTDGKPWLHIIAYLMNKICFILTIAFTTYIVYQIIHPDTIRLSSNTWLTNFTTEHIYPQIQNLQTLLQPYLQNLGLLGFVFESRE